MSTRQHITTALIAALAFETGRRWADGNKQDADTDHTKAARAHESEPNPQTDGPGPQPHLRLAHAAETGRLPPSATWTCQPPTDGTT